MKLLIVILSKTEYVPGIISDLERQNIGDPTVIDSEGALNVLSESNVEPLPMFGGLRFVIGRSKRESKTLLCALPDEDVDKAMEIIDRRVGGIDKPDTGVAFVLPIEKAYGLRKKQRS